MKVSFFKQDLINTPYASAIHAAIDALIDGSSYMVLGAFSNQFELEYSRYIESNHFVFASNGLDALILACEALDLSPQDEVIVPGHTYIASWIAPLRSKCRLVVAPVDETNLLLDPDAIENLITPRTKCILPVHLYGNSCNMNAILDIAEKHGLYVIEDAAQAHGSSLDGKKVGSFGDLTCFSFYPTKNLGGLGESGGVSTNSDLLCNKLKSLRNYGRDREDGSLNQYAGSNKRGDEIQAAFLSRKLQDLDCIKQQRLELIYRYKNNLSEIASLGSLIQYQSTSSPHLAVFRLQSKAKRDGLIDYLKENNIQTAVHYRVPCFMQPFIDQQSLIISESVCKQSQDIADTIISLPMSESHTVEEIDYVSKAIQEFSLVSKYL